MVFTASKNLSFLHILAFNLMQTMLKIYICINCAFKNIDIKQF